MLVQLKSYSILRGTAVKGQQLLALREFLTQCEPLLSTYLECYKSADSLHLAF